jgi:hypothetical protein
MVLVSLEPHYLQLATLTCLNHKVPCYAVSHSISGSKHLMKFVFSRRQNMSQRHGRRIITDVLSTGLLLGVTKSILPRINQAEQCWRHLIDSFSSLVRCYQTNFTSVLINVNWLQQDTVLASLDTVSTKEHFRNNLPYIHDLQTLALKFLCDSWCLVLSLGFMYTWHDGR